MTTYWITACVRLHAEIPPDPVDRQDDAGPIGGYYRSFGLTADSEDEAREILSAEIVDGEIDWDDTRLSPKTVQQLHPDIVARAGDWSVEGIWYRSGHAFFPVDRSSGRNGD